MARWELSGLVGCFLLVNLVSKGPFRANAYQAGARLPKGVRGLESDSVVLGAPFWLILYGVGVERLNG